MAGTFRSPGVHYLDMQERIREILEENIALHKNVAGGGVVASVESAVRAIVQTFKSRGKVLIAGNGGSAADSQHFAGELVGYFKDHTRRGYSVIALTTDTSVLTAWSNDRSFAEVFSRQVEAHGNPGDVFIGISTSGNSQNVLTAFHEAKKGGLRTIALLGGTGGKMKGLADIEILVPSDNTPRIQEVHTLVVHVIAELVEAALAS